MESIVESAWSLWLALACPILGVLLSILYRRSAGKPLFPRVPADARYAERWASDPFASNCLLVWVTADVLEVVPYFPFNLMFLPEIYRLGHSIPLTTIHEVERRRFALSNVIVNLRG